MDNLILIAVLAVILGAAGRYLYKAKKSGKACIGCPAGGCSGCSGQCSCCSEKK